MTDPELKQDILYMLGFALFVVFWMLTAPYFERKTFLEDCAETYTEQECIDMWRDGNG
jgi:hypothetical protein